MASLGRPTYDFRANRTKQPMLQGAPGSPYPWMQIPTTGAEGSLLGAGAGGANGPLPPPDLQAGSGSLQLPPLSNPDAMPPLPVASKPAPYGLPQTTPYTAPMAQTFDRAAPKAQAYGAFVAPNPADIANDPAYQFRAAEGQRAQEHSAAARGTLMSGAFAKSLERYRQGLASEEAGNAFTRALQTYGTNRDTAAQNYGQQMGAYNADLGAFGANTNAGLGYGRLGLDAAQLNNADAYKRAGLTQQNQQAQNDYQAQLDYENQVRQARDKALRPR